MEANSKILSELRPIYLTLKVPEKWIIDVVRQSVAREYFLTVDELYSTEDILDDIVREIVGNYYIPEDSKIPFLDGFRINQEIELEKKEKEEYNRKKEQEIFTRISARDNRYREMSSKYYRLSIMMLSMITMLALLIVVMDPYFFEYESDLILIIVLMYSLIGIMTGMILIIGIRKKNAKADRIIGSRNSGVSEINVSPTPNFQEPIKKTD